MNILIKIVISIVVKIVVRIIVNIEVKLIISKIAMPLKSKNYFIFRFNPFQPPVGIDQGPLKEKSAGTYGI